MMMILLKLTASKAVAPIKILSKLDFLPKLVKGALIPLGRDSLNEILQRASGPVTVMIIVIRPGVYCYRYYCRI